MTSDPAQPGPQALAPDRSGQQPSRDSEVKAAKAGYLGVIVLGPVIPLVIYAVGAARRGEQDEVPGWLSAKIVS